MLKWNKNLELRGNIDKIVVKENLTTEKQIASFISLLTPIDTFIFNKYQLKPRKKKGLKRRIPRKLKKLIKLANSKIHSFGVSYAWNKEKNQIELTKLITGFSEYYEKIKNLNLNEE